MAELPRNNLAVSTPIPPLAPMVYVQHLESGSLPSREVHTRNEDMYAFEPEIHYYNLRVGVVDEDVLSRIIAAILGICSARN